MTVHDPDHLLRESPSQDRWHDSAYNPDFLPEGGHSGDLTTCCNCLLPYRLESDSHRCPRCGANPLFAVPRHDAPHAEHPDHYEHSHHDHKSCEVDRFGLLILFVGFGLSLALVVFTGLTSSWAQFLVSQFLSHPDPDLVSGVRWVGFGFALLAAARALSSLLGWRSGHYFYRRFQLDRGEDT